MAARFTHLQERLAAVTAKSRQSDPSRIERIRAVARGEAPTGRLATTKPSGTASAALSLVSQPAAASATPSTPSTPAQKASASSGKEAWTVPAAIEANGPICVAVSRPL